MSSCSTDKFFQYRNLAENAGEFAQLLAEVANICFDELSRPTIPPMSEAAIGLTPDWCFWPATHGLCVIPRGESMSSAFVAGDEHAPMLRPLLHAWLSNPEFDTRYFVGQGHHPDNDDLNESYFACSCGSDKPIWRGPSGEFVGFQSAMEPSATCEKCLARNLNMASLN